MRRRSVAPIRALTLLALFAPVAALGVVAAAEPVSAQTDRGLAPDAYLADCAWCHGNEGEGIDRGPELTGVGAASADFYLRTGRMPIEDPAQRIERGAVAYSEEEIEAMVDYIGSLGGPSIPIVGEGELGPGSELYIDNCAACHSTSGIGAAMTSGVVAPDLFESSPVEVAEAIRIGPGTMPVFGPETLDDEQVDDIVAYVAYLQDPEDAGGAPLGHVGPITEGAVGWIIGAGVLVLIIRWVGTTADE